jgi:hypothetical protein
LWENKQIKTKVVQRVTKYYCSLHSKFALSYVFHVFGTVIVNLFSNISRFFAFAMQAIRQLLERPRQAEEAIVELLAV